MLKKLFYGSASILMLALTYHFGAQTAGAQASGSFVAITQANSGHGLLIFAVDASGGIYAGDGCYGSPRPFIRVGQP